MSLRHWIAERIPARGVRAAAAPYVAGDSLTAALQFADELWHQRGIRTTLDVLGEHVTSAERAEQACETYLNAADRITERPWASLSVKPGHFGFHVDPALLERLTRRLAQRCQAQGTRLTLDMEDRDLTEATIDLYRTLRPEFDTLGMVLQTKLFRTPGDLEQLAGLGARVRMCIGVYDVPPSVGHQRKHDAKEELLRLLPRALELLDVVELATHDETVIAQARELLTQRRVPRRRFEFQMLMGVPRRRLQDELRAAGHDVRLYVPFTESWPDAVAYLRRRLAESPSMAWLVARNLLHRG
ncbi:MAG: proline dehydrogenase family protein [Deltaproteobacteria bacterium]|nr:proline dehydrogenase family protein [Deltaproteobacteria bacterium]MBW2533455.1 proline dehydrogenase family protein [Deltaproteobacteria bacterium]